MDHLCDPRENCGKREREGGRASGYIIAECQLLFMGCRLCQKYAYLDIWRSSDSCVVEWVNEFRWEQIVSRALVMLLLCFLRPFVVVFFVLP